MTFPANLYKILQHEKFTARLQWFHGTKFAYVKVSGSNCNIKQKLLEHGFETKDYTHFYHPSFHPQSTWTALNDIKERDIHDHYDQYVILDKY
jgi:hypothetical protein